MSGFDADWLALRAGADARARDKGLAARMRAYFADRDQVRVLDLGAGTGANLRATAPLIGVPQHWVLADNDMALLARVEPVANAAVTRCAVDLAGDLSVLFDPVPDLVTASAFFDLCSKEWIRRLVELAASSGAALYAVLTYDGREDWAPPHPLDREVLAAFHADQRRDKGLGLALGPDAHAALAACLRGHGYTVFEGQSDWELTLPGDAGLIAALANGSAATVGATIGLAGAERWRAARCAAASVTIGHQDLLALPPR
ncbi:MAG TPA: class I SAM-dependent methyltransferase [Thermohalobaculum sp.]|nr:class I SAM-dependent methyltransferase [Thermohalobaculum sp.]